MAHESVAELRLRRAENHTLTEERKDEPWQRESA
jgi:hypothetical protein